MLGPRDDGFEIEIANNPALRFRDPKGILLRRMFTKPWQTCFDGSRLKLSCHHPRRHSGVVDFDNRRQVRLNSIADNQIHGFRFLIGLRVAAGELMDACVELAWAVAAGLEMGNANVGDGKADGVPDAL